MNFFRGTIRRSGTGLVFVETNAAAKPLTFALDAALAKRAAAHVDQAVVFGVRPEDVLDASANSAGATGIEASVEVAEPLGAETLVHLTTGATSFIARMAPTVRYFPGQRVPLTFKFAQAHLFDAATELVL
eukprot:gene15240-19465_t